MRLPVWGLYDDLDHLTATVRAAGAQEARLLFMRAALHGKRVRRLTPMDGSELPLATVTKLRERR